MENKVVIFWFRRDLRLEDNKGLQQALASGLPVLPVFIFDTEILDQLSNSYDRRVDYIHQALMTINQTLHQHHSALQVYHGKSLDIFKKLTEQYKIQAVYCNRDYEPQAIKRDQAVKTQLQKYDIDFYDFKDQVIFEQAEIVKADGLPYTVYTPYAKKWRSELQQEHYKTAKVDLNNLLKAQPDNIVSLANIGFRKTDISFQKPTPDFDIIKDYDKYRDFPSLDKTSHLGIALRFGTISIRECVAFAIKYNDTWLSELIWREFFMQILYHFPEVVHRSFKPQYDYIEWRNNEEEFQRWCRGETGYPIVDAGMRQLNTTGFMHNRVRMIVASFLCKHLLIDWRWGEAYFAEKLLDYDLAANNGNWQWAAGCGCDAAPYFRIFNPTAQTQKFDKDLQYIKKWNPDFQQNITSPIVQHEIARQRTLQTYKKALQNKELYYK
ncbi:deoxyribodipyrimidine photo-lyase [Elizabethkingia anophelis]|nr:deoxyribodipyrimidine photo-lyase [Elizabethkingia anophelis]MCT3695233.1 deoxyribodipyrimidine photo-lyase [Elizabethkingia anophelis]MCT3859326.1 deoxyribodipyrimidine photo-lyase [Elizabethkingia anophelis]MCT3912638.1 deoxyribodipyrimidine photo-lyase [Elizabethkingia anophelis]MCT4311664.1 deoxyribodipyrimidine photo-lyase [Elizabethkingia anophelis]